ncbi:hypothetical protein BD309DRAFT_870891 [Dichomitus squalens]|nr:hypothetical protein BD309DRAFT_870891 [Dichomitus squalens]
MRHDPLHGVYTQPTLSPVRSHRNFIVTAETAGSQNESISPNPDLHQNAAFKFARARQKVAECLQSLLYIKLYPGEVIVQCTLLALNHIQHGFPG